MVNRYLRNMAYGLAAVYALSTNCATVINNKPSCNSADRASSPQLAKNEFYYDSLLESIAADIEHIEKQDSVLKDATKSEKVDAYLDSMFTSKK